MVQWLKNTRIIKVRNWGEEEKNEEEKQEEEEEKGAEEEGRGKRKNKIK